jgi:YD repeat-containing protein
MTVQCWFKLSIPSSVTLSKNMAILSNVRSTSSTSISAYLIQFNIQTGNVEFTARGANGPLPAQTLITRPYLERWYHVAVTRSGTIFTGYADGRQQFTVGNDIGSSANTTGVFIGGTPDDSANLYGEVQEVAIYQAVLPQGTIIDYMFQSQPALTQPALKGYFTLGSPSVTGLMNSALNPPSATNPATKTGNVTFDLANLAGEQSSFDAHRNGGRDALAPLSGSFAWERTLFRRGTTGIPFEFKIGYNSAQAHNGVQIPQFPAFETNGLGAGWSHTFDMRIVPADAFQPDGTANSIGLLMSDGSLEAWDYDEATDKFIPRSGEYRGDLLFTGSLFSASSKMTWITPDRVQFVFNTPYAGSASARGRLSSRSRTFNTTPNVVNLVWDGFGFLQTVTDTAGGVLRFKYDAQSRLEYVGYLGPDLANPLWKVAFTYNAQNRLATFALTGPAAHTASPTPLPTTWGFFYKSSSDNTNGLLEKIADPRGYNGGTPSYYDVQLGYDTYARVISQKDGLLREQLTKYNVPATRQISRADAYQSSLPEASRRSLGSRLLTARAASPRRKTRLDNKTTFEFDAAGNITASVDANTNRTEFTYDTRSNVLTKKNVALNQTTAWQYNATIGTGG